MGEKRGTTKGTARVGGILQEGWTDLPNVSCSTLPTPQFHLHANPKNRHFRAVSAVFLYSLFTPLRSTYHPVLVKQFDSLISASSPIPYLTPPPRPRCPHTKEMLKEKKEKKFVFFTFEFLGAHIQYILQTLATLHEFCFFFFFF